MPITSLPPLGLTPASSAIGKTASAAPSQAIGEVGKLFSQALDNLSNSQNAGDALIRKLAAGENVDLHQVMIASEQADVNLKVTMAMRDKLVEAYHEVMRMAV